MKENLPKLWADYPAFELVRDYGGTLNWKAKRIEVEVVSLHLTTGKMRVRSISKIVSPTYEKPFVAVFDVSIDEFFKNYSIEER